MTSVTFSSDVGGDNVTIDDSDSATTGLANGGHRTRFMIALAQFLKVSAWVKATAQTVLGYRDAAQTAASQAQTYAGAAQAAAGVPSYAGKGNFVFMVNAAANGVTWSDALSIRTLAASASVTAQTMAAQTATLSHSAPAVTLVETDQAGAVGVFRLVADGGACRLDRNTAAARDFSALVTEWQVTKDGRHLFGGAADNPLYKYCLSGAMRVDGGLFSDGVTLTTSDRRLKRDIARVEGACVRLQRIEVVQYRRKGRDSAALEFGVIAQQLQQVEPDLVHAGDESLAVDYGSLNMLAVAALQETLQRLDALEGRARA